MRKREFFNMGHAEAVAMLAAAPVVRLAGFNERGEPLLRTLHAVVLGEAIYFHGAPVGEKSEAVGRPAVIAADEVVATIPSYVFDPEQACPATTYYKSAQVHGTLEAVEDPGLKAQVLQALMEKYQPEGGYRPITAEDPGYRGAVRGIAVVRMALHADQVDGKAKLGQNRKVEDLAKVLAFLWQRGEPGDARAVDLVRAANARVPAPEFLAYEGSTRCPGLWLVCALGPGDAAAACEILKDEYWNAENFKNEAIVRGQLGASAWVGARDGNGALIATGRALGDGVRWAYLLDIAVAKPWRGQGIGKALVRLLLDHPRVRGAQRVHLRTRDAQSFYADLGFREGAELAGTEMVLCR